MEVNLEETEIASDLRQIHSFVWIKVQRLLLSRIVMRQNQLAKNQMVFQTKIRETEIQSDLSNESKKATINLIF